MDSTSSEERPTSLSGRFEAFRNKPHDEAELGGMLGTIEVGNRVSERSRGVPKVSRWVCRAEIPDLRLPQELWPLDHDHGLLSCPKAKGQVWKWSFLSGEM